MPFSRLPAGIVGGEYRGAYRVLHHRVGRDRREVFRDIQ